jgi:hypothetical protein
MYIEAVYDEPKRPRMKGQRNTYKKQQLWDIFKRQDLARLKSYDPSIRKGTLCGVGLMGEKAYPG